MIWNCTACHGCFQVVLLSQGILIELMWKAGWAAGCDLGLEAQPGYSISRTTMWPKKQASIERSSVSLHFNHCKIGLVISVPNGWCIEYSGTTTSIIVLCMHLMPALCGSNYRRLYFSYANRVFEILGTTSEDCWSFLWTSNSFLF